MEARLEVATVQSDTGRIRLTTVRTRIEEHIAYNRKQVAMSAHRYRILGMLVNISVLGKNRKCGSDLDFTVRTSQTRQEFTAGPASRY